MCELTSVKLSVKLNRYFLLFEVVFVIESACSIIIIIENIMCIARENLVNNERELQLNDQQQQPQQHRQLHHQHQRQHQLQSHNNWFQSVRKVSKKKKKTR